MTRSTRSWVIFTIASYLLMLMLIPSKQGAKLSKFGFYLGFIQAVILKWLAVKKYKLWKIPGDILLGGIPILTCLSWIPPSMIYAYYYPFGKRLFWKIGYMLLFAFGTTIAQYIQGILGIDRKSTRLNSSHH